MAFEIKNPTLKNIIDFLRNQLGSMSLIDDAPSDSKKYSRKNGFWVEVNDSGGGGGESTNIGDEVYTEGDQLIIHSASTQVQDFFDNIAPKFDNTISNSTNDIVVYNNKLFTLTEGHTAPVTWENTTHVTTSINDILKNKVNISGDTMTGNLIIAKSDNPRIYGKSASVTEGIVPNQTKNLLLFGGQDSQDHLLGYMQIRYFTDNSSQTRLGARRTIDNSAIDNTLDLSVDSAGNRGVTVSSSAKGAWREAIGIPMTRSGQSPSNISISTAKDTKIHEFTLNGGTYILVTSAEFSNNATGRRKFWIKNSSTGSDLGSLYKITQNAVNGDNTCMHFTWTMTPSTTTTYELWAYQNSGSDLTVTPRVGILKLIDS